MTSAAPELHAFELKADYQGNVADTDLPVFRGATTHTFDGELIDVAKLLAESPHEGVIVVADPAVAEVLEHVIALKRAPVPAGAQANVTVRWDRASVPEMKTEAKRRGISGAGNAKRDDLVVALTRDDQRIAAGHDQPADYSVDALTTTTDED